MRIEPIDGAKMPKQALRFDATPAAFTQAQSTTICTVGFPGPPKREQGPKGEIDWNFVIRTLFGDLFGVKRLAPGRLLETFGAVEFDPLGIVFGHEATTFGGASGSAMIGWENETMPGFGLHFSGLTGEFELRHRHGQGRQADGGDRRAGVRRQYGRILRASSRLRRVTFRWPKTYLRTTGKRSCAALPAATTLKENPYCVCENPYCVRFYEGLLVLEVLARRAGVTVRLAFMRQLWVLSLAAILGGCTANPTHRYVGPSPIIDATLVEQSSSRINRIMNALARDTGGGTYYDLTEAGFNYIDDRCMEYFSELFFLNRRREAVKAGFNAFNQTTSAVLAAADASTLSMAVVAQAFGLASSLTDIATGTFLYQLPPATTLTFVRKQQGAYRDGVAARASQIRTQTAAYRLIQDYLALCLPPVIEANLVEHVADARAAPVRGGSIANIQIDVSTNTTTRPVPTIDPIGRASDPVKPVKPPVAVQPEALGSYEPRLSRERVARIQRSLCVSPATGVIDAKTRAAIDELFSGVEDGVAEPTYPVASQVGIQAVHEDKLIQAEKFVKGACDLERHKGPRAIGVNVS